MKVGLGTKWGFVERQGPRGRFWTVEGGLPMHVLSFRIIPSSTNAGRFDVDKLPTLGPWEDFADGKSFATPEEAAKFLTEKVDGRLYLTPRTAEVAAKALLEAAERGVDQDVLLGYAEDYRRVLKGR